MLISKKIISLSVAFIMVACTILSMNVSEKEEFYRICFIDCGRKYFAVEELKELMDNAAEANFSHVMLGVGNDGLRFLLDDMALSFPAETNNRELVEVESDMVKAGIQRGNELYADFPINELTEKDMDQLIAYAAQRGIGIIPMINTPGHMDAIIECMKLCGIDYPEYSGSARTVDITNRKAVNFTKALIEKYMAYFSSRGCMFFNLGCDEYANDVFSTGAMGFGNLVKNGAYAYYVNYVNALADSAKRYGLKPLAFNDGIYFNNCTEYGSFDKEINILYWTCGWDDYKVCPAKELSEKGYNLINVNADYYWVLGNENWQCTAEFASTFDKNRFSGDFIESPKGAMFCIWCDFPTADTSLNVVKKTADTILSFGDALGE